MTGAHSSPEPVGRAALCIEYKGSDFNGWQIQKSQNLPTVQESLESALSQVADHPVSLVCAGRTDTGVHATAQVAHFDYSNPRPESAWVRGGNAQLPSGISIRWAQQVDAEFHARFSATARCYRYVIHNNPVRPAILSGLVTPYHYPLDEKVMHEAGQALLGENDFSAYRGAGCQSRTPMRHVSHVSVSRQGDYVIMDIEANAFLLHMVRNIAGVLIEIGDGRQRPQWAGEVLASRDRKLGGVTALPDGLYLVKVRYPDSFGLPDLDAGPGFLPTLAHAGFPVNS